MQSTSCSYFERSLRGAAPSPSPKATPSSSRPAKKKSVWWNDDDEALPADCHSSSENGVLRSTTGANAAAAAAGGPLSSIHEQQQQNINHLRVPAKSSSARSNSARVIDTSAHNQRHYSSTGSSAGSGNSSLLAADRKRAGEQQQRSTHGGAVRVRTPAKPKGPRSDAASGRATSSAGGGGTSAMTHNFLRRGAATAGPGAAVVTSPKRGSSPVRRTRSSGRAIPSIHQEKHSISPRGTGAGAAAAAAAAAARYATTAPMTTSITSRRHNSGQQQRRMSSGHALRNVAGGNGGEDNDDADASLVDEYHDFYDEKGGGSGIGGGGGGPLTGDVYSMVLDSMREEDEGSDKSVSSTEGPSPMSLLSNTLSAIGLVPTGARNPDGRPPRSPRAGKGSPRASSRASPGVSPRASPMASPRASPMASARGCRVTSFFDAPGSGGRGSLPDMLEEDEDDDDDDDDFPLGVARQSLDRRLAAAAAATSGLVAAAQRASFDNSHNSASSLSPYTKSTTVRRTSTSLINVSGEPSSTSIVSEEVSEESSVTVTSAACGCHHESGCAIGAIGGQLPAGYNGDSIEVRDRLKELQGRNSTLEQEKVNLTLALAPLEERLQAKERAWESERRDLIVKSETSLRSTKVVEDRCRDVEKRKAEMEEERHSLDAELRRLRGEIEQRESKTAESFWQRTVAADREKTRLENALDQAEARVATLTKERSEMEAQLMPIQSENSSLKFRYTEAEKVASRVLTAEEGLRFSKTQLEVLKSELAATSAQLTAVQTELAQQKAGARKLLEEKERKAGDDVSNLRKEMQRLQETICSQADRVVAASKAEQAAAVCGDGSGQAMVTTQEPDTAASDAAALSSEAARIRQQELSSLRSQLEVSQERTRILEKQVEEGEEERRRMHNTILDLSGSVRVYVRARPFLKSDGEGAAEQGAAVVRCGADNASIAVIPPDAPNRAISCAFDRVFGGHASQEDVFKEVSGFVQSALDGYKVCLFSYGQTGSGKTHTMTGSGSGMMRGIVPRAVEHILARVNKLQEGPWKYSVQASFLEIYNEELRDLLVGHGESGSSPMKLSIKKSASGGTEVAGLTKYDIDTEDQQQGLLELDEIMSAARRTRSVASTAMNAESSRSHSVFTLWLTGSDALTGTTLKGVLHLVDLAGSERLDRSGVGNDAQRLKETQAINKSLSCLADVFSALSAKSSHVPFRNSKLTYLMQDCLSGEGKALMFVNLSPTALSASETVCSLRFANQVNQVQLGKATRQLSLSKPTGSSSSSTSSTSSSSLRLSMSACGVAGRSGGGGGGPPSLSSPARSLGSRAARGFGSAASTAPPSPRSSQGGSFGLGRSSITNGRGGGGGGRGGKTSINGGARRSSRLSSSSSTTSPPSRAAAKTRGSTGGARGGARLSASGSGASARAKGAAGAGGIAARAGGRASAGGSRLPTLSSGRSRGSSVGLGKGAGGAVESGRRTSGSTRPATDISRSLPPSPRPGAAGKRVRLSDERRPA